MMMRPPTVEVITTTRVVGNAVNTITHCKWLYNYVCSLQTAGIGYNLLTWQDIDGCT